MMNIPLNTITFNDMDKRLLCLKQGKPYSCDGIPLGLYWVDGLTPVWEMMIIDNLSSFYVLLDEMIQNNIDLNQIRNRAGASVIQALLITTGASQTVVRQQLYDWLDQRIFHEETWWWRKSNGGDLKDYTYMSPVELAFHSFDLELFKAIIQKCSEERWVKETDGLRALIEGDKKLLEPFIFDFLELISEKDTQVLAHMLPSQLDSIKKGRL